MKYKIFTIRSAVQCWLLVLGLMLTSCFGSQADEESLEVTENEETNENAEQGQEAYEDNQIAFAGGDNELNNSNELAIGVESNEDNQLQENLLGNNTADMGNDLGAAEEADQGISNLATGNDADVLAEAGGDQQLLAEQTGEQGDLLPQQTDDAVSDIIQGNADAMNNEMVGDEGGQMMDNTMEGDVQQAPEGEMMAQPEAPMTSTEGALLPEMGSRLSYVVRKNDTLVKVATAIYGDESRWRDLARWSGFSNPHLIYPGNIVYYQYTEQSAGFASRYEGQRMAEREVQAGDTLSGIAQNTYGNPMDWVVIWRYNGHIDNPDRIKPGQIVYYPEQLMTLAQLSSPPPSAEEPATVVADTPKVEDNQPEQAVDLSDNEEVGQVTEQEVSRLTRQILPASLREAV